MNEMDKFEVMDNFKVIKDFIEKCQGNELLTSLLDTIIECWMSGVTTIYCNINDTNNLAIIQDFLQNFIRDVKIFIQQKNTTQPRPDKDFKDYKIQWYHSLEEKEAQRKS